MLKPTHTFHSLISRALLWLILPATAWSTPAPVIDEIAWMGSRADATQWLELFNPTTESLSLEGWKLQTADWSYTLGGKLAPRQTLLLAHTDADTLGGVPVQQALPGPLLTSPAGTLKLIAPDGRITDQVDGWPAGDAATFATMQRQDNTWITSTVRYDYGYGTPGFPLPADDVPQHLHRLYHDRDTINIFFNQQAFTELALPGNEANHQINLEDRIIDRIRQARHRIDVAVYELNLPAIVTALMDRAAEGVQVRLIVDAKEPSNFDRNERFRLMRVYLEQLRRGHDGIIGTRDDVALFANSPIFAVTNPIYRRHHDLPETLEAGWQPVTLRIGKGTSEGHLLVDGALNKPGIYYAPGGQMHNKFILIDDYRVLTGSLNLTETGIYGSRQDRLQRRLNGNANNLLDIHSTTLTTIYRDEFNQMWGSTDLRPNPVTARFRGRKIDQPGPHQLTLGDTQVQVFFSPGYNVIPAIRDYIQAEADESLYFCIFAWSDSELENAIKQKWEGNPLDSQGELTGFRVKGVFERIFWNQWWSASINMMGEMAGRSSPHNPNIRWRHAPPVFRDRETRKLHHKYMLVDAENPSRNPTVITGSANWSRNANESNDENTLFIHDPLIANQYVQEFYARYQQAGGSIDHGATRLASSGFPTPDTP